MTINRDEMLTWANGTLEYIKTFKGTKEFNIPGNRIKVLCNYIIDTENGQQQKVVERPAAPEVGPDNFLMDEDIQVLSDIKEAIGDEQSVRISLAKERSKLHNAALTMIYKRLERFGYIFIHQEEGSNSKLVELVRMPETI